jgi:hypothetical protein
MYVSSAYFETTSMGLMFSYHPSDIPIGLLPEMYPRPFGVHYFGDFLDTLNHSLIQSPFTTPGMSPVGYPPFSLLVIAPFGLLPIRLALPLYLTATVLVLLVPIWRTLGGRPSTERLLLLAPLTLSGPFLCEMDRANIQGLVVGFALFGLLAYHHDRRMTAGVLFGLSAAMKAYPVLLILLLIRSRDWRAVGASIAAGAVATIASFAMYGDGPISNFQMLWDSTVRFRTGEPEQLLFINHSFKGGLAALTTWPGGWLGRVALWVISHYEAIFVLCLIALVVLVTNRTIPLLSAVSYIVLCISFGIGISFGYQPLFLFLIILIVYSTETIESPARLFAMLAIAGLLAPKGLPMGADGIPLFSWVDPALALIATGCLLFADLRMLVTERRERPSDSAERTS